MIGLYIRRPKPAEAVIWDGTQNCKKELAAFFEAAEFYTYAFEATNNQVYIRTPGGEAKADVGDFIVKESGRFFPCKAEEFYENYTLDQEEPKWNIAR